MRHNELASVDSFGGIDADADALLAGCFENHPAYVDVTDIKKFLVLGRKGSGKTAIYRRILANSDYSNLAVGYSFDDYPWHHHDLQAEIGVPEERRYLHSWKYLILMSLAKVLLNQDSSQPWSEDCFGPMQRLEAFVVDSYGTRDPDMASLFSPSQRLKIKGSLDFKFVRVDAERIEMRELPVHVQAVNREMQRCIIECLNPGLNYHICFDQLDLGFNPRDTTYSNRLIGLILAAKDLFVAARDAGKHLNPAVFLRDDIYQDLSFEDKNKITENYSSLITWSASGSGLTLKSLMERRFNEVLGGDVSITWDDLFEEKEMPGRQPKYQHICDRTFLRPRDMIKFCNEILEQLKIQEPASGRFDNSCLHEARRSYSKYLLNEIEDEITKHVPTYSESIETIRALGKDKFQFDEFTSNYISRLGPEGGDPVRAIEGLFEFSVISYLKPGGIGGGSEYVWRYKDPRARFDRTVKSYRVHPGFKEALGLTTPRTS